MRSATLPYLRDACRVDLDTVNFDLGRGTWRPAIRQLERVAKAINRIRDRPPAAVFLIEGHTDAVGSDVDNLALSDRRAERWRYPDRPFDVPPENLVTQGYGERSSRCRRCAERQNRRVTVRRITPLLTGQSQSTGQAN